MKRIISTLSAGLLCLALAVPAYGQSVSLGGKLGIAVATLGGDIEDATGAIDSKTGFTVGGFASFGLSPLFDIQPEVLYVQRGGEQEAAGVEGRLKLNYVEVPVLAKLNFPVEGATPVKPHVYAGPSIALELSCDIEAESGGQSAEVACDDSSVGLETKSFDLGLVFGGGVGFALGPGMLTLDGRYVLGMTDINDVAGSTLDARNRTFQVMAGYGVTLGT